jgi:hypothetical protein
MMRRLWMLLLLAAAGVAAAAENVAPYFQGEDPESSHSTNVGELFSRTFQVVDADGDEIKVTAEGLPDGAKLHVQNAHAFWEADEGPPKETRARSRAVVLTWRPTRAQRGDHLLALVASDGKSA